MKNMKCLVITDDNTSSFEYFRVLPNYPFELIKNVNIHFDDCSDIERNCHFTGPELSLFAKVHGIKKKDRVVIRLPFPIFNKVCMSISMSICDSGIDSCISQELAFLQDVFCFLPKNLVNTVLEYHKVPLGDLDIKICDEDDNTETTYPQCSMRIPFPTGESRNIFSQLTSEYFSNVTKKEKFPIWSVIWAFVRYSDPFTLLKDESKNTTGIHTAQFVSQKTIDEYKMEKSLSFHANNLGVKQLHIQFEDNHPNDVMCIIIKHVILLVNIKYEELTFIEDMYSDSDSD